jgi:hypothetical protein
MNSDRLAYMRFLLTAWLTLVTLAAFALYFGVRNSGRFRSGPGKYLWAATAGLLTAATNIAHALLVMPWVFWSAPVLRNEQKQFSPFTTTFLNAKRDRKLAQHLMAVVNDWDPHHFN